MSYYTTYNREKEKVTVIEKGDEKDCFLSLAYRELFELPRECIARLEHVQHLDLSHNKFSDLHSLHGLSGLTSLVLDSNEVTSHSVFPKIPKLQVLWLNKNKIANLSLFIENVSVLFPHLRQLSMMNNPAAPSYFNGGSRQDYQDYRHYVISQLPRLEYLDDTFVSSQERENALKIYDRRRSTSTLNRGGGEGGKDTRGTNGVKRSHSMSSASAPATSNHRKQRTKQK